MASHLVISAQVIERSCDSLLADMMVVDPILVASIQIVIQLTNADLPIPRPDEMASCNTSKSALPWFSLMCSAMSSSTSRCHLRGPVKFSSGVPLTPHGNANITNASGLSLIAGLHSRAISSCSSSALYLVLCMCG